MARVRCSNPNSIWVLNHSRPNMGSSLGHPPSGQNMLPSITMPYPPPPILRNQDTSLESEQQMHSFNSYITIDVEDNSIASPTISEATSDNRNQTDPATPQTSIIDLRTRRNSMTRQSPRSLLAPQCEKNRRLNSASKQKSFDLSKLHEFSLLCDLPESIQESSDANNSAQTRTPTRGKLTNYAEEPISWTPRPPCEIPDVQMLETDTINPTRFTRQKLSQLQIPTPIRTRPSRPPIGHYPYLSMQFREKQLHSLIVAFMSAGKDEDESNFQALKEEDSIACKASKRCEYLNLIHELKKDIRKGSRQSS